MIINMVRCTPRMLRQMAHPTTPLPLLFLTAFLHASPLLAAEEEFAPEAVPQATLASGSLLLGEPLAQEPILSAYYSAHPDPLWYTQAAYPNRQKLLAFISGIADEGLLPQDYHLNTLGANCGGEIMTRELQRNCDLLLSDGFLTLANHLANGKVNPTSLTPEWKTQTKLIDLGPLLGEIGRGVDAVDLLVSLRPKSAEYQAIRTEIPKLRARLAEAPPWEPLPLKPSIKVDMEDARLGPIIERLMYWGDLAKTYQSSGRLDTQLQDAVKNFQKRTGLDIDAVIGKST
ncbi:MAG: hypothetical protein EOP50_16610, partial [Sphingobacteriales bacterium]